MPVDYDMISARYDGFRGVDADLARAIGAEAKLFAGARVLDIGCGTGNIEAALAETIDLEVVGVDVSFGMLAEARAKIPRASWIQADSSRLPLRDEAFDCVLILYMLHHLPDFRVVIRNACAALREGRLVIVTASHKQIDDSFSSRFFPSYAVIDKARFPKVRAIVEAMIEAGFSDVSSRAITVAKAPLDDRYIEKIENKLISTFHIMEEQEFRSGLEEMKSYIGAHAGASPLEHKGTLIVGEKTAKR